MALQQCIRTPILKVFLGRAGSQGKGTGELQVLSLCYNTTQPGLLNPSKFLEKRMQSFLPVVNAYSNLFHVSL